MYLRINIYYFCIQH